jgi:hypothetical protein
MNCKKAKKLLIDYAEESLANGRRKAVESHLSQCECCRAELSEIQSLRESLLALEATEPGADFWDDFNRNLSEKLAAEQASAPTRGFALGPLSMRPRLAFAAAVMTVLLVAVLAIVGFILLPGPPPLQKAVPPVALNGSDLDTIDLESLEVEYFLKNGHHVTDVAVGDLSEEEMEALEEEMFMLVGEDWDLASEDMVLGEIYEHTVYDMLDELSDEEMEALYKKLGLT